MKANNNKNKRAYKQNQFINNQQKRKSEVRENNESQYQIYPKNYPSYFFQVIQFDLSQKSFHYRKQKGRINQLIASKKQNQLKNLNLLTINLPSYLYPDLQQSNLASFILQKIFIISFIIQRKIQIKIQYSQLERYILLIGFQDKQLYLNIYIH
ncbi:hypothetical protein ABPG74_005052 [Tetrahymena malaccensis]